MESAIARAIQILLALGGAYLAGLWIVMIVWTYRDIETRSRNVVTQVASTILAALFFIPGVLLYMLLRPKETLDNSFQRTLEEEYLLQDLEAASVCPSCERPVDEDFVICPHCEARLKEPCANCGRSIDVQWSICPYCGNDESLAEVAIRPTPTPILRFNEETERDDERLAGGSVTERQTAIERDRIEQFPDVAASRRTIAGTEPALPIRLFDRRRTRETGRLDGANGDHPDVAIPAYSTSSTPIVGDDEGTPPRRSNG